MMMNPSGVQLLYPVAIIVLRLAPLPSLSFIPSSPHIHLADIIPNGKHGINTEYVLTVISIYTGNKDPGA